ncbi:hypothetical protein BDV23DRAFT_184673 [Aspergillus alliaceus]|uniref:Uncharacterized protein n=1 Tax=Petromyces alliaceus TaxID=209559 RepID=A0A5N7C5A1_PETAA|nr:hypothetical protein BDV23DRAFT_184673 [Aspergillus alliaceus]
MESPMRVIISACVTDIGGNPQRRHNTLGSAFCEEVLHREFRASLQPTGYDHVHIPADFDSVKPVKRWFIFDLNNFYRLTLLSRCLGWRLSPAGWTLLVVLILLPIPDILALVRWTRHLVLQGNSTSRDVYGGLVATDPEPASHIVTHLTCLSSATFFMPVTLNVPSQYSFAPSFGPWIMKS